MISHRKPSLKAIAAMSLNRAIGIKNRLPWHLPDELAWFKQSTMNQTLLMGRKTFESMGKRALPNRYHIILSSKKEREITNTVSYISSIEEVFALKDPIWICGGATIYQQLLPFCEELFLTIVKRIVEGDTFFPFFEDLFSYSNTVKETCDFRVEHWKRLE